MDQYKVCTACKESKTLDSFYINRASKDGLNTRCRACVPSGAAKRRLRVAKGLPRYTDAELAWRKQHPRSHNSNTRTNNRARTRARYAKNLALVQATKVARGCADCGYNAHPVALDFDHLPGTDKISGISRMMSIGNFIALEKELEKCEVVCANCHRIRSSNRREEERAAKLATIYRPLSNGRGGGFSSSGLSI